MRTIERLTEVQAELERIQAEQNRPAQLAAELVELQTKQAQEDAQRQALVTHYNTVIQAQHEAERLRLADQRAALLEQYQQVRQALDTLIAGVRDHDQAARAYVKECVADEVAGGWLVGRRLNVNTIGELLASIAWQEKHEAMLHLLTTVNSEADIENYASRHLKAVSELRTGWLRRFNMEYASQVTAQLPDPAQRIEAWALEFSLSGVS